MVSEECGICLVVIFTGINVTLDSEEMSGFLMIVLKAKSMFSHLANHKTPRMNLSHVMVKSYIL